jgi:signal peptidase I
MIEAILFILLLFTTLIVSLDRLLPSAASRTVTKPKLIRLCQALLPALILVFVIRSFIFEGYRVQSTSMQPTVRHGDWIIVDKFSAGLRVPLLGYRFSKTKIKRGDIIVFKGDVVGSSDPLIKRVAGLPGDLIRYQNRKGIDFVVPQDSYFVLGDNRDNSSDSREWGVVADRAVIGKARLVVFGAHGFKTF